MASCQNPPRGVHLDAPGQRHGQQPVCGTADPRSSQTDKSSGGSVDTTKTRSDPQRVGMCKGERPIGTARGKQPDTRGLVPTPPPPQRLAQIFLDPSADQKSKIGKKKSSLAPLAPITLGQIFFFGTFGASTTSTPPGGWQDPPPTPHPFERSPAPPPPPHVQSKTKPEHAAHRRCVPFGDSEPPGPVLHFPRHLWW